MGALPRPHAAATLLTAAAAVVHATLYSLANTANSRHDYLIVPYLFLVLTASLAGVAAAALVHAPSCRALATATLRGLFCQAPSHMPVTDDVAPALQRLYLVWATVSNAVVMAIFVSLLTEAPSHCSGTTARCRPAHPSAVVPGVGAVVWVSGMAVAAVVYRRRIATGGGGGGGKQYLRCCHGRGGLSREPPALVHASGCTPAAAETVHTPEAVRPMVGLLVLQPPVVPTAQPPPQQFTVPPVLIPVRPATSGSVPAGTPTRRHSSVGNDGGVVFSGAVVPWHDMSAAVCVGGGSLDDTTRLL